MIVHDSMLLNIYIRWSFHAPLKISIKLLKNISEMRAILDILNVASEKTNTACIAQHCDRSLSLLFLWGKWVFLSMCHIKSDKWSQFQAPQNARTLKSTVILFTRSINLEYPKHLLLQPYYRPSYCHSRMAD